MKSVEVRGDCKRPHCSKAVSPVGKALQTADVNQDDLLQIPETTWHCRTQVLAAKVTILQQWKETKVIAGSQIVDTWDKRVIRLYHNNVYR